MLRWRNTFKKKKIFLQNAKFLLWPIFATIVFKKYIIGYEVLLISFNIFTLWEGYFSDQVFWVWP